MQYKVYYSRGQLMGTIEADNTEEAWAKAYDLVQSKPELHGCWINHRNTRLVMVEPFPSPAAAPTLHVGCDKAEQKQHQQGDDCEGDLQSDVEGFSVLTSNAKYSLGSSLYLLQYAKVLGVFPNALFMSVHLLSVLVTPEA